VFRSTTKNPQEEKEEIVALFSQWLIYPQFPWVDAIITNLTAPLAQDCYPGSAAR